MKNIIKMTKSGFFWSALIGTFVMFLFGAQVPTASAAYCPFSPAANRTIVNFDASIIWGRGTDRTQVIKYVNLPAGTYRVSLSASDSYEGRQDASQSNESYYVQFKKGSTVVAETNPTPDLQDRVRTAVWGGQVNSSIVVSQSINTIVARHADYIKAGSGTDSLDLGCAAFDLLSTPTPNLDAICSVNPSVANIGGNVNWSVSASGGTGSYLYSWTGTDGLYGSASSVSKSYSTAGAKSATVTVTSGTQTAIRTCNMTVNQPVTPNLSGSCSVSSNTINVGGSLNWSATASGGDGNYSYSWSGTDGLGGTSSVVSKSYSTAGTKTGTVLISSAGQTVSYSCNASVAQTNVNLSVSCDVDDSSVDVDEDVRFTAYASGGDGSYTYNWTGSEGLFSTNSSFRWSFDNDGTKRATVTVFSGGLSASDTCTVRVREDNNDDLRVSCYASPSDVRVGEQVRWYAEADGGDGDYDYDWSGTDGLNSSNRSPSITYNTAGVKSATVRVYSDGQSRTAFCYANVNQNSVLSFTQQNPNQLLGAVYLSEVPYTGVADNLKLVWFILGLALFSAYAAYVVISHKKSMGEIE